MGIRNDMHAGILGALLAALPCLAAAQATPSFDCSQKLVSSVEQRICKDEKLAAADREVTSAPRNMTERPSPRRTSAAWSRSRPRSSRFLSVARGQPRLRAASSRVAPWR